MHPVGSRDSDASAAALLEMARGAWVAQAVHVAAKLGIADQLEGGPQPPSALARAIGADADALRRVLRALASMGVFAEDGACLDLRSPARPADAGDDPRRPGAQRGGVAGPSGSGRLRAATCRPDRNALQPDRGRPALTAAGAADDAPPPLRSFLARAEAVPDERGPVVRAEIEVGFAEAALVLDETFVTQSMSHHAMEPRTSLTYWQNGKCFVHGSVQSVSFSVPTLANLLQMDPAEIVLIAETCGGGFGGKGNPYPSMVIPAFLSRKAGRPVMLRVSRAEEYFFGFCRPGFQGRVRMGFRPDGQMTALDNYIVQANGAYVGFPDFRNAGATTSILYQPESMRRRAVPVLTNTPPAWPPP